MRDAFQLANINVNIEYTTIKLKKQYDNIIYCIGTPLAINNKSTYLLQTPRIAEEIYNYQTVLQSCWQKLATQNGLKLNNEMHACLHAFTELTPTQKFQITPIEAVDEEPTVIPFNNDSKFDTMNFGTMTFNRKTNLYVFINIYTYTSFVSTNPNFVPLFKKYPVYGFRFVYSCSTHLEDFIKFSFDKQTFFNNDELELRLKTTDAYINASNKTVISNTGLGCCNIEKTIIKNSIGQFFLHTGNKADKILSNNVFGTLEKHKKYLNIETDGCFKYRLTMYLNEMGIDKKRLDYGQYYFIGLRDITIE
jgi:hypothetical protein